jgi:hypothetical protein
VVRIVGGMDICMLLDDDINHSSTRPIPPIWGDQTPIRDCDSIGDLVAAVRQLDTRSDQLLLALIEGPARKDPVASSVIVSALVPLVLRRCGGKRELINEFVGELALVIAEVPIEALRQSSRRVGGVLLDRAWDEVRGPLRRPDRSVPVDPGDLFDRLSSETTSVEDEVLDRLMPAAVRAQVCAVGATRPCVVEAWNTAIELFDHERRTPTETRRWFYVRRLLREDPLIRSCA